MTKEFILRKPAWAHFAHVDQLIDLPLPALLAADQVWEQVRATGKVQPTSSDYAIWSQSVSTADPLNWLENLQIAFQVILPNEVEKVRGALSLLPPETAIAVTKQQDPFKPWDPCEYQQNAKCRSVSVYPWELPEIWRECLRRAAQGLPGKSGPAPSREILKRMVSKLCQLAWCTGDVELATDLNEQVVGNYFEELKARLQTRPQGLRWATLRATAEELHRFGRYIGTVSDHDLRYLSNRLNRFSLYEKGQAALKFQALLDTGNTTLSLLEKADALLVRATQEKNLSTRHMLRNAGAILGLYSIVPLRNADAGLVFGDTLLLDGTAWVVDTPISKTRKHNPDRLVVPLEPEFSKYIDAVVQGEFGSEYLPDLRSKALNRGGFLFVPYNRMHPSSTYIPRLFKEHSGTSFTTTRTMLHSDQAIQRGEVGTRDVMVAAHQTSPKTATKYHTKRVAQAAIDRMQTETSSRRAKLIPEGLSRDLSALKARATHFK